MFGLSGEDFKTLADIGLGAISLMLWLRQGKTNDKQTKALQDLNTMVERHDDRIEWLETHSPRTRRRYKKAKKV